MSLARTLMNGGFIGSLECNINPARYGHAQGATVIAMESVEELHEIFLESYNYEQAELAAATEGVALEGSQYEAVAEAATNGIFAKVKEFFVKLWNKVKAFFREVRKYLDAIFMSGKDFVIKYKKEINRLDNLKDFKYKMYNYDDAAIDTSITKFNPDTTSGEIIKGIDNLNTLIEKANNVKENDNMNTASYKIKDSNGKETIYQGDTATKALQDTIDDLRADDISDRIVKAFSGKIGKNGACTSAEDFNKWVFGVFRNGAESEDDKEERDLTNSNIEDFAKTLETSKAQSSISGVESSIKNMYKKAIDTVNKAEMNVNANKTDESGNNGKVKSKTAELLRAYSTYISNIQTYHNTYINGWKAAIKERDSAYKSCIMAAMTNNRKNTK